MSKTVVVVAFVAVAGAALVVFKREFPGSISSSSVAPSDNLGAVGQLAPTVPPTSSGPGSRLEQRIEVSPTATSDMEHHSPILAASQNESNDAALQVESEDDFKWLRATATRDQLIEEHSALNARIGSMTVDAAVARIADGEFYDVATNEKGGVNLRKEASASQITLFSQTADGRPVKVVLPESQFPEAYQLKRQVRWLDEMLASSTASSRR